MPQVIDLTGYQSPFPALAQRNQENLQRAFENEVARRERLKQFEYAKALQEDARRTEQERYDFGVKLQLDAINKDQERYLEKLKREEDYQKYQREQDAYSRKDALDRFEFEKTFKNRAFETEQDRYLEALNINAEERAYQREQDAYRNKINQAKLGADFAANYGLSEGDLPELSGIFGDTGTQAATSVIRGNNRIATANAISAGAPSMSDESLSELISLLPEQNRPNAIAAANSSRSRHNMYSRMLNDLTLEKSGIDKRIQSGALGVEEGMRMISQIERSQRDIVASAMKEGIDLVEIPGTGVFQQVGPFSYGPDPVPEGFSVQNPAVMNPGYVPPGTPLDPNSTYQLRERIEKVGSPQPLDVFPVTESRPINQGQSTTSFLPEELPGGMFSGRNRVSVENHKQDLEGFLQNLGSIDVSSQPIETQKKIAEEIGFIDEGVNDIKIGEYNTPAVQYLLDVSGISEKQNIRKIPSRLINKAKDLNLTEEIF